MKKIKEGSFFLVSLFLCFILLFTSIGLTSADFKLAKAYDVSVWYCDAETYVCQTKKYDNKNTLSGVDISMAKNEYESYQIIITPAEDVESYTIETSDLSDGKGNTISASDIDIFAEGYIFNEGEYYYGKHKTYLTDEYVPDYLVPFDSYVEKGENKIKAENNQGLYVRVKTNKDTVSGTYTGSFSMNVDGMGFNVPVKVQVWDITVSDDVNTGSIFLQNNDFLVNSPDGNCSDETLRIWYDFFLDHRISLMNLPATSNDVDKFLTLLREYYNNPKVSAYAIPYSWKRYYDYTENELSGGYLAPDLEMLQDTVNRMVSMSVQDKKNYLDKAFVYNLYVDEFRTNSDRYIQLLGKKWGSEFADFLIKAEKDIDATYGTDYLDSVEGLRFSLKHISNMQVGAQCDKSKFHKKGNKFGYNVICPEPHSFNNDDTVKNIFEDYSAEGDEIWWYTCMEPVSPFPNYHTSNKNSLLSARVLSWLQYEYKIEGNLYFMVNNWANGNGVTYKDIYADGSTKRNIYGDGNLIYPGSRYNQKTPIGTMRLESIRDGLEDYNLLEQLSEKYNELNDYYSVNLDTRKIMSDFYNKISSGTVCFDNVDVFYKTRSNLVQLITNFNNLESKIVVESVSTDFDKITVSVLVPGEYVIENGYNSVTPSGNGNKYVFVYNRDKNKDIYLEFTADKNGEKFEYKKLITKKNEKLFAFDNENDFNKIHTSDGASLFIDEIDGRKITGCKFVTDPLGLEMPSIRVSGEKIKENIDRIASLTIDIYNPLTEEIELNVYALSDKFKQNALTVQLKQGWNEVNIEDVLVFDDVKFVVFEFENKLDNNDSVNYTVYLSDFAFREI